MSNMVKSYFLPMQVIYIFIVKQDTTSSIPITSPKCRKAKRSSVGFWRVGGLWRGHSLRRLRCPFLAVQEARLSRRSKTQSEGPWAKRKDSAAPTSGGILKPRALQQTVTREAPGAFPRSAQDQAWAGMGKATARTLCPRTLQPTDLHVQYRLKVSVL